MKLFRIISKLTKSWIELSNQTLNLILNYIFSSLFAHVICNYDKQIVMGLGNGLITSNVI